MSMKKPILIGIALLASQATWAQADAISPPGRLLASNCFQCHGTNGRAVAGIERLAGMSSKEIAGELQEMKAKSGEGGIMRVHALGYTDAQIKALGDYFALQTR
jgi:cytochrome subunit of sulfide dehydrogenase